MEDATKGYHLTEEKIAKRLGVSRTPVREVLRHFEEEGLLERKQWKGIRLREIPLRELIEIYDLRSVLEGLACKLLAQRIDEKLLRTFKKLSQRYNQAIKRKKSSSLERLKIDLVFHQLVFSKCGNEKIQKISNTFHLQILCFHILHRLHLKSLYIRGIRKYTLKSIVKALEKRDPDEAEMAAKLHIQESKEELLNLFLGPSIPPIPIYKETN